MSGVIISVIISLVSIFLYTGLGAYVLKKNPYERTNQIFVLLMLAFIIWSVATYGIGMAADTVPLGEVLLYMKLHISGVVLALMLFILFAISFTKEKLLKNPLAYSILILSVYLLSLIWTADLSNLELGIFKMAERKQDYFLYSAIFGIAGVYLLLRHYMTSRYRQREQARIISAGAIISILAAVFANILLPMFSDIYFLPLSTIAPALMGVFFAYAVYQYGLFITPMPELSVTSFCGVECALCQEYLSRHCAGCKFNLERYRSCGIYLCLNKKRYKDCGECPEILTCTLREETSERCFKREHEALEKPRCELIPGSTYFVKDEGYDLFLDAIKCGAFGLVVSTMQPEQIREKYCLLTTPIVWISDEALETGVKPGDLKRLSAMTINFMKRADNAVVFIDGLDMLISINGFSGVQHAVQILNSAAQTTDSILIISTNMRDEALSRLKPLYFSKQKFKHGKA